MADNVQKTVPWIIFDTASIRMRRVISPKGKVGILIATAASDDGERLANIAEDLGFARMGKTPRALAYFPQVSQKKINLVQLADALGGRLEQLPVREVLSAKITLNLVPRAKPSQSDPDEREPNALVPDPETLEEIGLNLRGEEVVRDRSGRYFRKIDSEDGSHRFAHESEGGQSPLFLRATKPDDLNGIAAGMLRMAGRGTLHQEAFDRVLNAALEVGPLGQLDLSRDDAASTVRRSMLRQITATAVNDAGADKSGLLTAIRLSESANAVLDQQTGEEGFQPSAALLSLIRRLTQGYDSVDFRGHPDLEVAVPRLRSETASLQVQDLTGISEDNLGAYALNVISRRPEEGSSVFILKSDVAPELLDRFRYDLGRIYGLEAVAEISPEVSDGVRYGTGVVMFFAGELRPEPLESLPQAALRTFNVVTSSDLVTLEREVVRSRSRIKDFNRGEVELAAEFEDDREENTRQRPYKPLSKIGEPFTMIPKALEGATSKAFQRVARDFESRGGIDAVVSASLGATVDEIGKVLIPEQIDVLGMQMHAAERGRGFLVADQTGIGKGRSLCAIGHAHMRSGPNKRLLLFTESGSVNVPDVVRDLRAVGLWGNFRVGFLSSNSRVADLEVDPATGQMVEVEKKSIPNARQKEIFESMQWPEEYDVLITTYSKYNSHVDAPTSLWIAGAMNDDTMIILDEAHNALNPNSNQGRNIRSALDAIPASNAIFGTATPARNPTGLDLYRPLLPVSADDSTTEILKHIQSGGEVAQEVFTTMLAEDGAMLRRDHDLSNIDFQVNLPDDTRMLRYQDIMNRFSPIVEGMIDASTTIGQIVGRRQAVDYQNLIRQGLEPQAARSRTNELNQYSLGIGGPLSDLARITMNAIKVDQVVEVAIQEMDMNRKPLITLHSTNQALFTEMSKEMMPDGTMRKLTDEELEALPEMTLKDQIRRIHDRLYFVKLDEQRQDARELDPTVAESYRRVSELIDQLPDDLPVSPLDALKERLEANGMSVGEVTGRTMTYRNGRISRRTKEERDRRSVIDGFNSGKLDVLVYNSAGATGGSYHASPDFLDQRGRTMIEFETPVDIIKYVQSQGRGNRYGQVVNPRVVSVMTGLTPEMRILQQRNGKLRLLGASVDGNRAHPLLLDDVPDLLNKVGDEATKNVLLTMHALARRLGFEEIANQEADAINAQGNGQDEGSGTAKNGTLSLANKVLTRSIMLPANEQEDLVRRVVMEFDALIEELDSRNANPLKPKEFPGQVEIKATSLFSGQETEDGDLNVSAFRSPLYIATGIHRFNEEAVSAEKLITMVERCVTMHGGEGFAAFGQRVNQNLPTLLRPHLPAGYDMEAALQNPEGVPGRFARQHAKLTDLAWLLDNFRPGVSVRFPDQYTGELTRAFTVVGMVTPSEASYFDVAASYKVELIAPGEVRPIKMSLSRFLSMDQERIMFRPGLSEGINESFLEDFTQMANVNRSLPVQILQGNILEAIKVAETNNLGGVSLYRTEDMQVNRGIVVHEAKTSLEHLPVNIPSGEVLAEAIAESLKDPDRKGDFRIWGAATETRPVGTRSSADNIVRVLKKNVVFDLIPFRKTNHRFYAERPGLYEILHQEPLPSKDEAPEYAYRRGKNNKYMVTIPIEEGMGRIYEALKRLDGLPMQIDSSQRKYVNEAVNRLMRIREGMPVDDNEEALDIDVTEVDAQLDIEQSQDELELVGGQDPEINEEIDTDIDFDDDVSWG